MLFLGYLLFAGLSFIAPNDIQAQDKNPPALNEPATPEEEPATPLPPNLKLRKAFLEAATINEPDIAYAAYKKIIQDYPNTSAAYYNLARLSKILKEDFSLTKSYILKAINLDPQNIHYRIFYAELIAQTQPQIALAEYLHCIRIQPRSISLYLTTYQLLESQLNTQSLPLNSNNKYIADTLQFLANLFQKQFGTNSNSYRMHYYAAIANNQQSRADSILLEYQRLFAEPNQTATNHSKTEVVETEAEIPSDNPLTQLAPNDALQSIFSPYLLTLSKEIITDTAYKYTLHNQYASLTNTLQEAGKNLINQLEEEYPYLPWDTLQLIVNHINNKEWDQAKKLLPSVQKPIQQFTISNFYNHISVIICYQSKDFSSLLTFLHFIERTQSVHPSILPIALNCYQNDIKSASQQQALNNYKKLASELSSKSR